MQASGSGDNNNLVAATIGGTEGRSRETAQPIPVEIAEICKVANKLEKQPKMVVDDPKLPSPARVTRTRAASTPIAKKGTMEMRASSATTSAKQVEADVEESSDDNFNEEKGLQLDNGEECILLSRVDGKATVGRAVIMGQPGSKFKSKIIPPDWHIVKVVSAILGEEDCPLPPCPGKSQMVMKIKDVVKKTILWPDSHIGR